MLSGKPEARLEIPFLRSQTMLYLRTGSKTILHALAATLLSATMAVAQTAIGLSPNIAAPGSSTVITGSSFIGTSQVTFNGHQAVFQVDSATKITAIVPLAAMTGLVEVTTPSGIVTSSQSFEVIAKTWNAVQDFSTASSNPNGAWSYGWAPSFGGAFSLMTSNQDCQQTGIECWWNTLPGPNTATVSWNSTADTMLYISVILPTSVLWLGAQANAVITRWTAPYAGNYSIIGSFEANDTYESKVKVGILKDGSTFLLADNFSSFGNTKSFALSNIPLAAGTTIDFELGYTDTADSDNASLVASINLLK
jgi:hypothetical protein